MATLKIKAIQCKRVASGVDTNVTQAFSQVTGKITDRVGNIVGSPLKAADQLIRSFPNLIAAIDAARGDPDQLYLSLSNRERESKIWPNGPYYEILSDQVVRPRPNISIPFSSVVDVNLWEYDSGSDDDFLGRLTVYERDKGPNAQIIISKQEGSVYIIEYEVR